MEGVSPSVLLVPAQSKSRRLAAKACWAAWVRMADQRERREASTALRRMWGTALAFVRPRGGGKLLLPGSTGPLFRWRGPRACTFWNGEVLGMCAPWLCVRPGALLLRIGRHVFGAGWRKSKEIPGWCRPRVALPPTMGVHWLLPRSFCRRAG